MKRLYRTEENAVSIVLLTALGVGGATVFGAALGFVIKKISYKFNDMVLAAAAGVMLAAAFFGLVLPSLEGGGRFAILVSACGIICGALFLLLLERPVPHLYRMIFERNGGNIGDASLNRILLFVAAIAVHNFPEGLAAGVGFGTGNTERAIAIAVGIAIQNIPEGMVIIAPMLSAGISRGRTFLCALATGVVEVIGTLIGYFCAGISAAVLPFALAFAGGTMIYVICDSMIPEFHSHGNGRAASVVFMLGFCAMLMFF